MAEFAAKKEGVKTVAIVDDRTAFGQEQPAVFKQVAEKNGLQVVAHEFTSDKAVDFMPILTSIKTKKPDAILFGGLDSGRPDAAPDAATGHEGRQAVWRRRYLHREIAGTGCTVGHGGRRGVRHGRFCSFQAQGRRHLAQAL